MGPAGPRLVPAVSGLPEDAAGYLRACGAVASSPHPELRVTTGTPTWTEESTRYGMDHCRNVRAGGVIIYPTWAPPAGAEEVRYHGPDGPESGRRRADHLKLVE
jgi:hypothetical protein